MKKKTNIVINNYFKTECSVDTTIREAFEKGFRLGIKKVKAQERQWIPCSERPPRYDETDETSEYLVTDKAGRVRHCCLDPYMPETFVTVEEGMIVDAVAWRPAPEPYKGGENE